MFWLGSGHCHMIYLVKKVKGEVTLLGKLRGARRCLFGVECFDLFVFPYSPWYCSEDSLVSRKGMILECDYCACLLLLSTSSYCFPSLWLYFNMFLLVNNFGSLAQGRISYDAL